MVGYHNVMYFVKAQGSGDGDREGNVEKSYLRGEFTVTNALFDGRRRRVLPVLEIIDRAESKV